VGNGIELHLVRACIPQDFGKIINEEQEVVSSLYPKAWISPRGRKITSWLSPNIDL